MLAALAPDLESQVPVRRMRTSPPGSMKSGVCPGCCIGRLGGGAMAADTEPLPRQRQIPVRMAGEGELGRRFLSVGASFHFAVIKLREMTI